MRFLRTNTAARVSVGPFLGTDGLTPKTALTVTSCKLTLMVDSANVPTLVLDTNPTASGGSNDMVHVTGDDAGFYDLELAAADVNYLGRAILSLTDAANHCPVFHEFMILPAMIYDSLVLGTDRLDTNATHLADQAITAAAGVTFPASVASPTNITAGTITTVTNLTNAPTTGDLTATMKASVTTAATAATPNLNAAYDAAKNAATQASVDDLPTNAELATALASADDAVLAAIPSAATTASAVRTELATELDRVDAAISTRATPVQVNTEVDTALADYDAPTKAEMDAAFASGDDAVLAAVAALNNLSQAGVRAAVGLGSANLDSQLAALAGFIDTEMAAALAAALAIKLQTDKLTFNGSNQLAANVKRINDVTITGDGSGTPFGV